MIPIRTIFDDLGVGVLKNLSYYNPSINSVNEQDYPIIVSYINLALIALFKRFLLRTGEVIVQQHPSLIRYPLRSQYAASNATSTELIKYIMDSDEHPFQDDILKIEQVFSELGEEYIINDSKQPYPIFTPTHDTVIMVPTGEIPQAVSVIYRARHPAISMDASFDPFTTMLNIPEYILDALYARVGAYAYKGVSADDTEASASRSYMVQYESECQRLEIEFVAPNDNEESDRFDVKGWA